MLTSDLKFNQSERNKPRHPHSRRNITPTKTLERGSHSFHNIITFKTLGFCLQKQGYHAYQLLHGGAKNNQEAIKK